MLNIFLNKLIYFIGDGSGEGGKGAYTPIFIEQGVQGALFTDQKDCQHSYTCIMIAIGIVPPPPFGCLSIAYCMYLAIWIKAVIVKHSKLYLLVYLFSGLMRISPLTVDPAYIMQTSCDLKEVS